MFFVVAAFELELLKTPKLFVERWMKKQLGLTGLKNSLIFQI